MDNQPQNRNSIVALVVGGAALVATIVLGVIQLLINAGALTLPNAQNYTLALQVSAVLTVVGFASYIILEPDRIRQFLAGRQARYGSNALLTILAFTGIVFVVNYMMATNADLVALHADLTEDKANTLSPEMIQAMQNLPGPLTATGFYTQADDTTRDLFNKMRAESNGLFSYSFLNPDKNPAAAKEAGVTGNGKILLEMNGRREIANYADEGEILTALNRILSPEQRAVYFLAGHQEADIEGSGDRPMRRAKEILEKKNFVVKTLNLLAENAIPADAKAIIIAGPQTPLSPAEVDLLNTFALNGGGLIVMEDPLPLTDFGDSPDPLLDMLSATWGLVLRNDFVVDPYNAASYTSAVGVVFSSSHQITRSLVNVNVVLPLTRSVEVKTLEGFTTASLVETADPFSGNLAWGETDFAPLESNTIIPEFNSDVDTLGPITLVASSEKLGGGRVVVAGSALFAADQGFDAYANNDLFVNSVAWAAGQEAGVDITTQDPTFRTFKLPSQAAAVSIYIGSICLLPGLVLGAGIYAWVLRRRRG